MNYYSYILYSKNNKAKIEKYQLPQEYSDSALKGNIPSALEADYLDKLFIHYWLRLEANEVDPFLNYHLQKYENSGGDRQKFISHTSQIINKELEYRDIYSKIPIFNSSQLPVMPVNFEIRKQTLKWLSKKEDEEVLTLKKDKKEVQPPKWFPVGLVFATGEIHQLLKENNTNFTKVARILGDINLRPYISETISNTNNNSKNLFRSPKKLAMILDHCSQQGITMDQDFLKQAHLNEI